ncbi:hypothetical protein [Thalassotalea atypica]|uniref:hypothetical protein n=1 Tax=Thalassotalea atypica TaxID=2054316 RepID=UPI0025722314|nr:hypothetical protein [Thalassotalea atypica]
MSELTMNQTMKKHFHAWGFQAFKYLVYTALAYNVYLFFQEEWLASSVVFAGGITFSNLIEAFSSTIDTGAWLVLLLLFELETYVIDDSKLTAGTKRVLHGIRAFCYLFILYSLYGYMTKVGLIGQFTPHQVGNLCDMVKEWKFMETLNVYNEITPQTCKTIAAASTEFYIHAPFKVIVDSSTLTDVKMLAWVDVINASAWVGVVIMLEIDVHTQLGNISSKLWEKYNVYVKVTIYSILFMAAVFWGVTGNFLEFWDAFLWIVAFVLIERNIFEWQAEIAERNSHASDENTHS